MLHVARHRSQHWIRMAAWSAVPTLILSFAPTAPAANLVWTGAQSTDWSNPANWSTGTVPATADTLYLVSHDTAGVALPNLPSNVNLISGQVANVIYVGSTALTVSGSDLTLGRLATRFSRNLTYVSGTDVLTVVTGGTTGLQVGMAIATGDGIVAGTTISQIIDATTIRVSSPTTAVGTNRSNSFDARANVVWNSNLSLANATETFSVAINNTVTVNGNISGVGSLAFNYGYSGGILDLKGTNSYSGPTIFNLGTLRFWGAQSISPSTTIGLASNSVRFASSTGSGDFAYSVPNTFEVSNASGAIRIGDGGRVSFTGTIAERPTPGIRGLRFFKEVVGPAGAVAELKGSVSLDGGLSVDGNMLVRLHSPLSQPYGGNTDITSTTDMSQLDGTLDLMGNNFDRKINSNNESGIAGAGNLVNSKLASPSTVSGLFVNLGTNVGNRDFGGPGSLLITGNIRVTPGAANGTGYNKSGPGAAIIRSGSFLDSVPANNNPNEVFNGSLVLDNTANNNTKMTADGLTLGNGRLVILGNASSATTYTATTLTLSGTTLGGTSDKGFAEIDVRNNGGGAAFNFTTLSEAGNTEPLNFQVNRGSGGSATIGSTQTAGKLGATITFNRNQWASATGSAIVGVDPGLIAADAATFQSSSITQDIDVTGSYATTALTNARTLRFTQAAGNTLTLNANLQLNKNGDSGSGIMVVAGAGPVTIDGSSNIDIGVNTGLTVHHYGDSALRIDARILGASGAKLNKVGTGELVLGNASSTWGFSNAGATAINLYEGTVTLAAMANTGVNSPIGTNGTIVIGSKNNIDYVTGVATQQPARLRYTGTGHQSNRVFQLVGVSEIQANGSGPLDFTNTGDVVTSVNNTGAWNDLILSGSGSGQFAGAIKLGMGDLVKRDSGTWTLSSTSSLTTYGKLLVEEGTLVNNGTVFIHTDVLVSGSGKLAGSGIYNSAITITSTGALSPGNSAGKLTMGSLDLQGSLIAEILGSVAGTGYDQVAVNGSVTLGSASNLQLSAGYVPEDGAQYVLIANDGSVDPIVGMFATANGAPVIGNAFTADGYLWALNYTGGDGNDLIATVTVPEPGIAAAAVTAMSVFALRRRRRA